VDYRQSDVKSAFQLYAKLSAKGLIEGENVEQYIMNDDIRSLLELFALEVECVLIQAGDVLYLVPKSGLSPFHVKNDIIRRELGAQATNADLYMMYFSILIFIGEFYNSYQSNEIQRDFLTLDDWLTKISERIDALKEHDEEELKREEHDFEYNWVAIIEKWEALNDLKESVLKQKGKTVSRLSFLNKVLSFMINNGLIEEIGEEEYSLTEKTRIIVQRYFMESEYNRGILKFMYQFDEKKGLEDAVNI
jgi:hypothetical protein